MGTIPSIDGTSAGSFHVGGPNGPAVKNNAGAIEARNAADSTFAVVRGATPVGDNDLANKAYVDQISKPVVASAQFNGNNPLPANTGVEHFYVVTTTGANASIGQLLWDDGSGAGTVAVVPAQEGRSIFTTALFSGGTITLQANSYYVWDTVSSSWLLESSSAQIGLERVIDYQVTEAGAVSQDSASQIPAAANVYRCTVIVTTPWSAGGSIQVGKAGSLSLIQATNNNVATVNGVYPLEQNTAFGGPAAVRTTNTAGAGPAAGVARVVVLYAIPTA